MNKAEKFIVAFLLANIALAGALHFFSPPKPAASAEKSEAVESPGNTATQAVAEVVVSAPAPFNPDASTPLQQLRQWAKKDPGAAWDWILKQPDDDGRVEMLEALCCQIAEDGDPARAVAFADKLHLTQHGTLANLEQQWAQKDLPAARDWVVAKPPSDEKDELLQRVAYVWASSEPENAARFAVEKMQPGNTQIEAVISVLHQWALRDGAGAAAWVQLFPEGNLRTRAMNELEGIKQYQSALSSTSPAE